ncbi:hypothetical protein JIQ42_06999 [Leishmania sp. Namibia]|uniref:hypothetical protein n=1 Tax=Leishmania sp. Namibia TaxID=2802991 RepID=UPI001B4D8EC3|nr:hypothetical protein JIQ42_06999 [Leishmania sp. Namibia]
MSQPRNAESLLYRYLKVDGGSPGLAWRHRSPPSLVKMASSPTSMDAAVALNGPPPAPSYCFPSVQEQATPRVKAAPPPMHRDVRCTTSSSSARGDMQEEAATPPRCSSSNQNAITTTSPAGSPALSPAPSDSRPGTLSPAPGQGQRAVSPGPRLSLSHPVVQFLSGVQLQGYAAHLIDDLGIRSMQDLAERGATSKGVAALLGPFASLQQKNELLRGLRRWERDEARRVKAEAAEARRRTLEKERGAKRAAKDARANTSRSRAAKTNGANVASACTQQSNDCETGNSTGRGRESAVPSADLVSSGGASGSGCFCPSVCDVLQSRPSASVAPSPRTSATQLMRDLSYPCSHSRQAAARRRGDGRHRCGQGESADATSRTAAAAAPYDVDAEDVDAVTASETAGKSGCSEERGLWDDRETSATETEARVSEDAVAALPDEESLPKCTRRANIASAASRERDRVEALSPNLEGWLPRAALSPARHSSESRLSSILCSLREAAEQQSVVPAPNGSDDACGEGPTSVHWAPAVLNTPSRVLSDMVTTDDAATAPPHHSLRNDLVTMSDISLGALSACAELQVLPPLERAVAPVRARAIPVMVESSRTVCAETHSTAAKYPVIDSDTAGGASQQHQLLSTFSLTQESATQPRQREPTDSSLSTRGAAVAAESAPQLITPLESRLADARRRLADALQEALWSYNAEVKTIGYAAALALGDTAVASKCVPLRAVVQPMPLSLRAASAPDRDTEAAELGTPVRLVLWTRGEESSTEGAEIDRRSSLSPTALESTGADANERGSGGRAVLPPMISSDTSPHATARSTAAPSVWRCGFTSTPAAAIEDEGRSGAGALDPPTAAESLESRSSKGDEDEEDGDVSCESVGRLTAGTQRLSTYVNRSDAQKASEGAATAAINDAATKERSDGAAALLWVAQGSMSTMQQRPFADAAYADSKGKEKVAASDEWWEAYGIDALEYTQNSTDNGDGGRSASPGVNAVHPCTTSNGGRGSPTAQLRTSVPASVEVIELTSGTDEEDADSHGNEERDVPSRSPHPCSYLCEHASSSLSLPPVSPPRDPFVGGVTALLRTAPTVMVGSSLPSVLDKRLYASTWPRMTNTELRQLCGELGLRALSPTNRRAAASFPVTAAYPPCDLACHCQPAPLPSSAASPTSMSALAVSRESSLERDLFGPLVPTTAAHATRRELFRKPSDAGDGVTPPPEPTSPIRIPVRAESGSDGGSAAAAAAAAANEGADSPQRCERRAALLERESLLESLQLLAIRLRFRQTVAPFFLHRVARLSGLPYKRIRVADLLDEGTVLTREDLKQARLRYKAEEQAEVDRCIVSALVADAAETVEQSAERVASRLAALPMVATEVGNGTAVNAATACSPQVFFSGVGAQCCYDQILLRESVHVDATVAVVQRSFSHIAHTRVQQLLAANEVMAETVVAAPDRSPSPLPSPPVPQSATTAQLKAGQAIAVPRVAGELTGDGMSSMHLTNGDGALHPTAAATPLSQEERRRVNTRRYFAQRGYITRRPRGGWGRGRR